MTSTSRSRSSEAEEARRCGEGTGHGRQQIHDERSTRVPSSIHRTTWKRSGRSKGSPPVMETKMREQSKSSPRVSRILSICSVVSSTQGEVASQLEPQCVQRRLQRSVHSQKR